MPLIFVFIQKQNPRPQKILVQKQSKETKKDVKLSPGNFK